MKLVFALLIFVNDVPQDPILFGSIQACNQIAFSTEKGVASDTTQWSSHSNRIEAYCIPRVVEKSRTVISVKNK